MGSVILEILGVSCTYGAAKALDNLGFKVNRGDFVGIIGPNGSGKSTLLKTVSRVLPPKQGKILLGEKEIYKLKGRDVARQMAAVTQDTGIDFAFTVREIVLMGRIPHLRRFQSESADDFVKAAVAMELTGITALADRPINAISGGERQRVLIARALCQEPEILLLDEPTSHLDINHQVEILDLLKRLNRERRLTVLMVLHDLNLASQYCDDLLMLKEGRIFALGSPEEVVTPQKIKEVYGSEVLVSRDPVHGRPCVTLLPKFPAPSGRRKQRIHLVGGGGSCAALLEKLVYRGYRLSAGVLNVGDSDWQKAKDLGVVLVEAPPFSPVNKEQHRQNLQMMELADLTILADVPFGPGNLLNLLAVKETAARGEKVLVLDTTPVGKRDYTGGLAAKHYEELLRCGVWRVQNETEALAWIEGRDDHWRQEGN